MATGDDGWARNLLQDWHRVSPARPVARNVLGALVYDARFSTVFLFRLSSALRCRGWRRLSRLVHRLVLLTSGCDLSPKAEIGPGLLLPHPTGVVIGHGVVAGRDLTLFQHVTLGGRAPGDADAAGAAYPRLADRVVVYPGALVYGDVAVGSDAVVLGNSVVSRSVPAGVVVAGAPARARREVATATAGVTTSTGS